jgi:allene oxide cyclase
MIRKLLIGGCVLVLGPLALGLARAAAQSSNIDDPVSITVIEHSTTDTVVDVGKKGDSTGDILTFHNALFDAADTTKVGTDSGQCVRESPKAGSWECWWTSSLAHGQITIEGPFFDSSGTILAAVTGGTGMYSNARGSMRATCVGAECTFHFSLIS